VIGGGASGFFVQQYMPMVRVREVILFENKSAEAFIQSKSNLVAADAMSAIGQMELPSWLRINQR